jgi:hypothetical protein
MDAKLGCKVDSEDLERWQWQWTSPGWPGLVKKREKACR